MGLGDVSSRMLLEMGDIVTCERESGMMGSGREAEIFLGACVSLISSLHVP